MTRLSMTSVAAFAMLGTAAMAQPMPNPNEWTGEGAISAAVITGNTKSTDAGIGIKAAKQFGDWRVKGALGVDYGKNNSVESRNRWSLTGQLDRDITNRFFVNLRGTYEEDKFSGFDSRSFVGVGAGYKVLMMGPATWTIEGGPGYRRDVFQATGKSKGTFGARLGSVYAYKFNDAVNFTNDTEVVYSDVSTQIVNIAAVTAKMTDKLAARFSYEVRNESDPPFGRKSTDTISRISLVYGF